MNSYGWMRTPICGKNSAVPEDFPEEVFADVAAALDPDPEIDGVLPVIADTVAVVNLGSQQFEANALITGLDPSRAATFDEVFDTDGQCHRLLNGLGDDEFLHRPGRVRRSLDAEVGRLAPAVPGTCQLSGK